MKKSPLQLKHYHYTKLMLEVNADFDAASCASGLDSNVYWVPDAEQLKTVIRLRNVADQEGVEHPLYALEFLLDYANEGFPYAFSAGLLAFVTCEEPLDDAEEKNMHLLVVNTVSMLFSAVREQLLTLSSRHQHGPIMLPALDFRALMEEKQGSASSA